MFCGERVRWKRVTEGIGYCGVIMLCKRVIQGGRGEERSIQLVKTRNKQSLLFLCRGNAQACTKEKRFFIFGFARCNWVGATAKNT